MIFTWDENKNRANIILEQVRIFRRKSSYLLCIYRGTKVKQEHFFFREYKKHGIDFDYAVNVFDDENRVEFYDEYHDEYEERFQVIGKVNEILFVVVTYRENNETRIISARKANKRERMIYYGDCY